MVEGESLGGTEEALCPVLLGARYSRTKLLERGEPRS